MPKKSLKSKNVTKSKVAAKSKASLKKSAPAKRKAAASARIATTSKSKSATTSNKSKKSPAKNKVASKKVVAVKKAVAVKVVAKTSSKPTGNQKSVSKAKQATSAKIKKTAVSNRNQVASVLTKSLKAKPAAVVSRNKNWSSHISADDLQRFRAVLLQKRRRLMGDVAMMSEEALGSEEGSLDNHAPIHPAEVGSHSFEQEFTLGLLSRDGDRIQMIEVALEKMSEGTYGQCDECESKIPKGRLELLPESIFCVKCASRMEGGML